MVPDITVAPYDAEAARQAVALQRHLSEQGTPTGAVDAMIADTTLAHDESVATRNINEFNRTPAQVSLY